MTNTLCSQRDFYNTNTYKGPTQRIKYHIYLHNKVGWKEKQKRSVFHGDTPVHGEAIRLVQK